MNTLFFIALMHFAAPADLAPRMEVLQKHYARLQAITVSPEAVQEKTIKMAELKKLFEKGVPDGEAYDALYRSMDDVRSWLWQHALDKPKRAEGSFEDTSNQWVIITPECEVALDKETLALTLRAGKAIWKTEVSSDNDVKYREVSFPLASAKTKQAEAFPTGYSNGMVLTLSDFPAKADLELKLCINVMGNEVVFEMAAPKDPGELAAIQWPKPIVMDGSAKELSVIPYMQGMLLPGGWKQDIKREDLVNSRTLYMPWWGQIRDGHGVLTILETSEDAGAGYVHQSGGATRIQPRWYASMGKVSYLRRARYVLDDNATYVTMAKRYRRYVQETGRFVSLEEKKVRTPGVNQLVGRPVVHLGALYHFVKEAGLFNKEKIEVNHNLTTFDELAEGLRQLKAKGIENAYVHLDGWGFYGYDNGHPDPLPVGEEQGGWEGLKRFADTCDELGYLFATHDQYRDFYKSAVSYADRLALMKPDGTYPAESTWCGGPQTVLSSRFAPEYVRRNHDLFAAHGIKVKGAYLDVFSVVPLEESWDPIHPVTRAECARYRKECFAVLRARGYVVSSEEPTDYLVSSLDLVHHGPYATFPKIGGGDPTGIPVPLFELVYHDALLTPWDLTEDGGSQAPKGDAGRLHCLLNSGMPYVGVGVDEPGLARVREACALNARCASKEMVNHEFLDGSHRKQRTTFSDGTRVTVDFDTKEYQIDPKL